MPLRFESVVTALDGLKSTVPLKNPPTRMFPLASNPISPERDDPLMCGDRCQAPYGRVVRSLPSLEGGSILAEPIADGRWGVVEMDWRLALAKFSDCELYAIPDWASKANIHEKPLAELNCKPENLGNSFRVVGLEIGYRVDSILT